MDTIMIDEATPEALKDALTRFALNYAANRGVGSGRETAVAMIEAMGDSFSEIANVICSKDSNAQQFWRSCADNVYNSRP